MSIAQRPTPRPDAPGNEPAAPARGDDGSATAGERVAPELIIVAVAAVLAGLVLRFVAITPLWLDEALSVNISSLPIGEIPEALRHDGHPPLYYVLLHGWMEVFGQSDAAVRALSGVISVATLPLAWLVAKRRGNNVLAVVTITLFAMAPFALRYATETRMYALVMFLVLAGYLFLDDIVRRGKHGWPRLVALALTTAALLYSHYWALWLIGAVFVVLVWRSTRAASQPTRHGARLALGAVVVGGLLFLPWVPTMLYQSARTATPWALPQRPTSVVAVTLADFGGGGFRDAEFLGMVLAVLFLLGMFGRGVTRAHIDLNLRTEPQFRYEAVILGLTLGIGSVAAYLASSAFASRYAAVIFPLLVLVVAGGITRFLDRWVRLVAVSAVVLLSVLGAYYAATGARTQADQIATAVAERAQPGDLVVYCPDQLGPAGERALPAGLDQVVFPDFRSPERLEWVDYLERNASVEPGQFATAAAERAGDRGIFLIWNGEYRGLEGKCEAVLDGLSAARGGGQVLLPDGAGEYFEHAQLVWFPPVSANG